ncbi:MAG: hypothetical protein MUO59_05160, partial [Actinobacteria bacterium]|nr:hypothetical protein [Actinomycetota bacterium]
MILNKARFGTRIGMLYYLWMDGGQRQKVVSVSISPDLLKDYVKKIGTGRKSLNNITINEKKLPILERKISDYMKGRLKDTGLEPVFLTGSEFEKKVWKAASRVPFGKTSSYRE